MTLNLINFVPNTKIKASEVNDNFNQIAEDLSLTQGTVEQLNSTVANGCVPVGAVFWFARQTVPDGYLVCNGEPVSRSTYAALYTAIGTTYGAGDGSTTFNLPLINDGRFIKGTAQNSVGGSQNAAVGGHTHSYSGTTGNMSEHATGSFKLTRAGASDASGNISEATSGNGYAEGTYDNYGSGTVSTNVQHTHSFSGTTGNNATGVENVPKNIALLPCIKY